MSRRRWFLPETLDVLGMLSEQTAITVEGLEALGAWARGDAAKAEVVRACEHRADDRKRELREALTTAFATPLEPEDLFALSRGLDAVLNGAKDAVREAEVMGAAPDTAMAAMADELIAGARKLAEAVAALAADGRGGATEAADAAVRSQRQLEKIYRAAASALLEKTDLREVTARRELYRRLSRTSDQLVDVAERVWYAVLKQG